MERTLPLLRLTLGGLFLWFGLQQWLHPDAWTVFLPEFLGYLPIPGTMLVMMNGWVEIVGAIALILGFAVRPLSFLLGIHLLGIAISAGGAIGVRDAALGLSAIALSLSRADQFTIDHAFN